MRVAARLAAALILAAATQWGPAESAQDHWYVMLRADNGSGMYGGPQLFMGADPAASEGLDAMDRAAAYWIDMTAGTRWLTSRIPGSEKTYDYNTYSSYSPSDDAQSSRAWHIFAAGLPRASNDPIRIHVYTSPRDAVRPPSTLDGQLVGYRLIMDDNRGVTGAPANGAIWDLPVTTASASYYLQLPMIRLSAGTHDAMISEGYRLRFEQYLMPLQQPVVPEPGSLSALALGIAGLAASGLRRRR